MPVVLGRVLQGPEASHGETGDGSPGELRDGAEGGVHPGDEFAHVEGLPVPGADVRGDRVGVPAGESTVGHDDDELAARGVVSNAQLVEDPEVVAFAASVEEVEHRVAACRVVSVGQQYVDSRVPADGRRGEAVVLHAAAVLVLGNAQARGLSGGRAGHGRTGAHGGEGGDPAHPLEHDASADPRAACGTGRRTRRFQGHRVVRFLSHGMYSPLLCR